MQTNEQLLGYYFQAGQNCPVIRVTHTNGSHCEVKYAYWDPYENRYQPCAEYKARNLIGHV